MSKATHEKDKSEGHIHHDEPAHNDKLRQINKGDYTTKTNFAQVTYDKVSSQ